MKLAVMGRSIRPKLTGVGRHVANLVQSLALARPHHPLTVFVTQDAPPPPEPNIAQVRAPFPTPNEYARALWEQTVVPVQSRFKRIELYHSPNYMLPLMLSAPSVVTIHDVTYLDPSLHRFTSHHYLKAMTAAALKKARAVIAVSEYTRQQVERAYPETSGRLHVIYQGLEKGFAPPVPAAIATFRTAMRLDHPFALFVGTIEPRKNVVRLIHAFEKAVSEGNLPHHLYLVGAWGWKAGPVADALRESPLADRIHIPGYVSDKDLPLYYAAADVLVYPSLEEGFGLPAAEAMACGAAVVTSNSSSLPEVVGDAAVTVDPLDEGALSAAICSVLTDRALREALQQAGLAQAARFTWERSAEEHLRLYQQVLKTA